MTRKAKNTKSVKPQTTLQAKMEDMALWLVERTMAGNSPPTAEETGVFKALSNFLAISYKIKPPNPDEEGSFSGYAESIAGLGARDRSRAAPIGTAAAESDED